MDEILEETGRSVNISAIHSALRRLDSKGFVKSDMGGATHERGEAEESAILNSLHLEKKALDDSQELRMKLYTRIPNISFGQ